MLASQVCWSGYYTLIPAPKAKKSPWKRDSVEHSLRSLARRHLGIEMDKSLQISDWGSGTLSSEQIEYAAKDAEVLLPLHNILTDLLKKNRLEHIGDLEFRALPAVVEIELAGLPIDMQAAIALMEAKSMQAQQLVQELQDEAVENGFEPRPKKGKKPQMLLNLDSRLDVLGYLQHQGQIAISTKEDDLKALKFSWTDKLLRYRRVSRQKKFLEDWLLKVSPVDDRLHAQYFQCSTVSGRFSSRGPNAQQIPKRGEDGMAMRRLFRAPAGRKLVKADFSGIELRIIACLSKDPTMIAAFQEGQDLHRLTASSIAGIPLEDVTKDQRQAAKGANFGLIYGASASRFQATAKEDYGADMSLEEAERIRRTFFATYPGIARWHQVQRMLKRVPFNHYFHDAQHGLYSKILVSSRTVIGRKRVWGWLNGSTLAKETELYNSPCQGTGADLIKIVMRELYERLISEGLEDVKIVGTIHDELILEAPEAQSGRAADLLGYVMRQVGSRLLFPVPVDAEVSVSDAWGEG
jgi:DNA polymerase-1